jgi:hypothetical protein
VLDYFTRGAGCGRKGLSRVKRESACDMVSLQRLKPQWTPLSGQKRRHDTASRSLALRACGRNAREHALESYSRPITRRVTNSDLFRSSRVTGHAYGHSST